MSMICGLPSGRILKNGYGTKGVKIPGEKVYKELIDRLGTSKHEGIGKGYPDFIFR